MANLGSSQHAIARKPLPPSISINDDASPVSPQSELSVQSQPSLASISPADPEPSRQLPAQQRQHLATYQPGHAEYSFFGAFPAESRPSQQSQVLPHWRQAEYDQQATEQTVREQNHAAVSAQSAQEAKPQAHPPVAAPCTFCGLCRRSRWPTEPKTLPSRWGRLWYAKSELLFVIIACGFLAVGILIIILNGQQRSQLGDGVIQTTLVIPSLWPLLFSAIVGGMLKVIAHRRLQHGASIRTLEQLMSSQTVFGAIKSVWFLRSWSFSFILASLTLLTLWSLSPIGSQAALRVLYLDTVFENRTLVISYMAMEPIRWVSQRYPRPLNNGAYTGVQGIFQSVFASALVSQGSSLQYVNKTEQQSDFDRLLSLAGGASSVIDKSTSDAWGNFRLPAYHLLLEDSLTAWSDETWLDVPADKLPPYAAGAGVPLRNLPNTGVGDLTFTIPASYYKFKCDKWGSGVPRDQRSQFQLPSHDDSSGPLPAGVFQTTLPFNTTTYKTPGPNGTSCDLPDRSIIYFIQNMHSISCLISTQYIETRVRCSRSEPSSLISCRVEAVKGSPDQSTLCPQITELDFANLTYFDELNYMNNILALSEDTYYPSRAEAYLLNPANVAAGSGSEMLNISSTVPPDVFGRRLGFVFNTWSMVYHGPSRILGSDGSDDGTSSPPDFMENTTATWLVDTGQVYRVNTAWLAAYLLSSVVLCVCSVAALVVQASQLMPHQLLGSVSTLTRDSPYFDNQGAAPGSTLGGDQRARLLRPRRIRLLDVDGDSGVGRLAIGSEDPAYRPADRNRMYS